MDFYLQGIIIGIAVAAPVGPTVIVCIQRSLTRGFFAGFVSGIGAATADGIYASLAAFGLTYFSSVLLRFKLPIQIIGALFLFYFAARMFFAKSRGNSHAAGNTSSLVNAYLSAFVLTIINPLTIALFAAMFFGVGFNLAVNNHYETTILVFGVISGSILWSSMLSLFFGFFKKKLTEKIELLINKLAAIFIIFLGILFLFD